MNLTTFLTSDSFVVVRNNCGSDSWTQPVLHPACFDGLKTLVAHCAEKAECLLAHTMATKSKVLYSACPQCYLPLSSESHDHFDTLPAVDPSQPSPGHRDSVAGTLHALPEFVKQ